MVKLSNPRVGHRVGGFYTSTNGRTARVGHRLPGGFYGSVNAAPNTTPGKKTGTPATRFVAFMIASTALIMTAMGSYWYIWIPVFILFTAAFLGSFVGSDGKMHSRN